MKPKIIKDPFCFPVVQNNSMSRSSAKEILSMVQNKVMFPLLKTNFSSTQSSFKQIRPVLTKIQQNNSSKKMKPYDGNSNKKRTIQEKLLANNNMQNQQNQINQMKKPSKIKLAYEQQHKKLNNEKIKKKSIAGTLQNMGLISNIVKIKQEKFDKQNSKSIAELENNLRNLSIIMKKKQSQEESLREIDDCLNKKY